MAAAIGTQRCTRARMIGAVERYQRLEPTASAVRSASVEVVVVVMVGPFGQVRGRADMDAGTAGGVGRVEQVRQRPSRGTSGCAAGPAHQRFTSGSAGAGLR